MTDSRSQDLLHLLTQDRAHPDRSSALQQISYRTQAESILGSDENLYRFEWIPESSRLSIQLVGRDSITMEDTNRIERDWADYLERFVLSENTAGVDVTGLQPFLKRSVSPSLPTPSALLFSTSNIDTDSLLVTEISDKPLRKERRSTPRI